MSQLLDREKRQIADHLSEFTFFGTPNTDRQRDRLTDRKSGRYAHKFARTRPGSWAEPEKTDGPKKERYISRDRP